jgi:hypothetical protein
MGLFDWFTRDPFCRTDFKPLFSAFIDAVVDSGAAQGPVVSPPRAPDAPAPRLEAALPSAKRLVAFGDIHGDMNQMKRAFKAAGLIDDSFQWSGGQSVAVQVRIACSTQPQAMPAAACIIRNV